MKFNVTHHPTPAQIACFADLKHPRERGVFIAEAEKIVTRLLESDIEVISLYLTEEHFESKKSLLERHEQASAAGIFIASKKEMERIVGFTLHQGILAAANIPAEKTLDEITGKSPRPQVFVVVDSIADAENMGAIYRTSLAAGATAIIMDERSVSPWMRRTVRVSMGAVFELPTVTVAGLASWIRGLNAINIRTFAAALTEKAEPIWEQDFRQSLAIVFGSEGQGIRKEILDVCSKEVMIPMPEKVDSLNVAVAQGMMLYEVMRQRNAAP